MNSPTTKQQLVGGLQHASDFKNSRALAAAYGARPDMIAALMSHMQQHNRPHEVHVAAAVRTGCPPVQCSESGSSSC